MTRKLDFDVPPWAVAARKPSDQPGPVKTGAGSPSSPVEETDPKKKKPATSNLTWHPTAVSREDRERLNAHHGVTLWFTGLSGSGKSTLANAVVARLHARGIHTTLLDGDNVRHGLNKDLGFSPEDRTENIRRVGEVAKLMCDAGLVTLVAFISPYRKDRAMARTIHGGESRRAKKSDAVDRFLEVYVKADLSICEARDPKGLYKKARAGEIEEFTGVSAPYEAPENPEIEVDTGRMTVQEAAEAVVAELERRGIVPKSGT